MEGHEDNANGGMIESDSVHKKIIKEMDLSEEHFMPLHAELGPDLRSKKLRHLRSIMEKDCKAIDMKWSLFVAACQSYRFDSVLRPFPPAFLKDGVKDIELLLRVVEEVPPISLLLQQASEPDIFYIRDHVIDLLYWAVISMREPYLKTVDKECFDSVLSRVPCEAAFPKPNYIFQLVHTIRSSSECRFKHIAKGRKTLFAYHGTKLENFHSVIHYGLQQHMSKNSLFGKGIYLTSELSVSLPYSPSGYAWGASKCGSELSCIALCELVDHEDFVKCQNSADEPNRKRNRAPGSIAGEVPNKYYVVTNSEMVRIRYLLVYSKPTPKIVERQSILRWLSKHKLITFFIGYGLFLSIIGIANSDQGVYLYELITNKIDAIYPFLQTSEEKKM